MDISFSGTIAILVLVFASGYATGVVSERDKCPTQPIIWEHTAVPQATEF